MYWEIVQKGPGGKPAFCWLYEADPQKTRSMFPLSRNLSVALRQMAQQEEGAFLLSETEMEKREKDLSGRKGRDLLEGLSREGAELIKKGRGFGVNIRSRDNQTLLEKGFPLMQKKKKTVHIMALGDVGATLLMGLRLLGGGVIDEIGIWDMREPVCGYWEREMNQISPPFSYDALPPVRAVSFQALFDCDVFLFCASKGVPALGSRAEDVRMVQLSANAKLVGRYARMARETGFEGLFGVVSDPVDPLCRVALERSNQDQQGRWDGKGLYPHQIQGFGLGVMNARAAYYAKKDPRFSSFLTQGRAFGPHGEDLVIANSIEAYDDALSRELTQLAKRANQEIRAMGFKPYVAPALSSGALSVISALSGQWHYGSVFLGGVFIGVNHRLTWAGPEPEALPLPQALLERILTAEKGLHRLIGREEAEDGSI